jgi:hypothetical protein
MSEAIQQPPSMGGSNKGDPFAAFDPEKFVKAVIKRFEASSALPLEESARDRLVQPAIDFRSQIIHEIKMGTATSEKLAYAVTDLLQRSEEYANSVGERAITEAAILWAMRIACHYLGWC